MITLLSSVTVVSATAEIKETAKVTQGDPAQPGGTVEITYTISNVGDQKYESEIVLEFLEIPEDWEIMNMYSNGERCKKGSDGTWATDGTNPKCWGPWALEPGEEWQPKIMFKIPSDANGEYSVLAVLSHDQGSNNFRKSIQVNGGKNSGGVDAPKINAPSFVCDEDCTVILVFTGFIVATLSAGYLILRRQRSHRHV